MITPYTWQQPSVDKLNKIIAEGGFAINASDTGTGKTIVALQVLKDQNRRGLIICPKAVHTAWQRTAVLMGCSHLIYGVTNPERLQYKNPYVKNLLWDLPDDVLIIWDEFHKGASGPKSKTTKIAAATKPQGKQMLAMSATIATSPLNMRALGYLAGLHGFRPSNYFNWCRTNGCFAAAYANNALVFPKGIKGQLIMNDINKQLDPLMTRISIENIPEFPETHIIANLYDIAASYTKEINEITKDMKEQLSKPSANPLTTRLKARQRTELIKVPLLVDLVQEAIEQDKSIVVFVNFRETLSALYEHLPQSGLIHGGQKKEVRQQYIDEFQEDKRQVLLATTQAGGVGISLHGLPGRRQRVSFITPNDSASEFVQCLGRIHRAGGSPSTQTIVLIAGTVEEKIHQNLQGKLANLKSLVDGLTDSDLYV